MRVLSLFSGVGGFDMGLEAAGMTTVFQCELDKNCRQTLDYHWPTVPKWDDVSTLTGGYILDHCDGVDVVAWGSPCQDLSVAGKRAGLTGERSGLFHQGIRIIKELRELSNGKFPTWSIWENVVGALSSNNGADFGEVLYEMDEAGACFSEWSVLDAQYFGVPQRRRRVFVLSCFDPATAERSGDKILAVSESGGGDSPKGKSKGQSSSDETSKSFRAGSQSGYTDANGVLRGTVTSKWAKGNGGPAGDEAYNLVVEEPLLAFDTQFGSNAGVFEDQSPTLKASQQPPSAAFLVRDREGKPGGGKGPLVSTNSSLTLQASNDQVLFVEPFASGSIAGYVDGVGTLRASGGDLGGGSETLLVHSKPEIIKVSGINT
jgi:DNA (cytosine-5)-methyltransferase 1